jgi:signal transduction histidine kinase
MLENISHQWKQPLHKLSLVIQNYYFKNKLGGTSPEELESFNEDSSRLLAYMSSTIDDFRNFFSPQKEKEYFDIHANIDKVLNILSSNMEEEGIDINIASDTKYQVFGYPNEFGQVLMNLFSNAKEAFVLHNVENKRIDIEISETPQEVTLNFVDNAGGIAKEILPKIFDPYFSTKRFKEGSGIGLYMSKMIIENSMHGDLGVENTSNGAKFTLTLPKMI